MKINQDIKKEVIRLATMPVLTNIKYRSIDRIAKEVGISFYQCKKLINENFLEIEKKKKLK